MPDMGQMEKEIGESHEWATEPLAFDNKQFDNKQFDKYNKNVLQ